MQSKLLDTLPSRRFFRLVLATMLLARSRTLLFVAFVLISLGSGLAAMQGPDKWPANRMLDPVVATSAESTGTANDILFVGGFELVQPPVIVSMPPMYAVAGVPYTYLVHAVDSHASPLLYSLIEAPGDMLINPLSGLIEWLPENEGVVEVGVQVRNVYGVSAIQLYPIEVLPAGTPIPVITSDPPLEANLYQLYVYDPIVVESEAQPLSFSLDLAPSGMSIDPVTGAIRWTPTVEGQFPVSFRVENSNGHDAVQSWLLTVVSGAAIHAVGGQVSGLKGGQLVLSESVSGQTLAIHADGDFQFNLADGSAYDIVIATLPDEPAQICWVERGDGQLDGTDVDDVLVGCLPSSEAVDDYIDDAQEEFDNNLPPTTTEEFEASDFGQLQMDLSDRSRRARAQALAMAAIDPDPDWFSTALEREFIVARPGQQLSLGVEKLDAHGDSLGLVPQGQLRPTVRIQRDDHAFEWLPTEFSDSIVHWSSDGARLEITVPDDLHRGRLAIGLRPNLADPGQRALAERWSAGLIIDIWPLRPGVSAIDSTQVLFPLPGAQPLSPQSAFTAQELHAATEAALADDQVHLPLVLASGTVVAVEQRLDYRVDGRPYGGRVVSITQRAGQTLAMLEPEWLDIYDVAEAEDGFLVAEGVLPEHVVYRTGGPIEGFDSEYRQDRLVLGDALVPIVPEGAWAIDPASGRARAGGRSAHALFIGGCGARSASLTFSPILSLSPLEMGVDISVGSDSASIECIWRSSNQAANINIMRSAGPLGLLASALVGSEIAVRPYGEVRFSTGVSGALIPGVTGFSVGLSTVRGATLNLGVPSDANQVNDLENGTPIVFSGKGGVAGGIEVAANLVSPRGVIGWLLSVLGGVDTEIGVTARLGIGVGVVVEGANAPAVYQNDDESRGAGVIELIARLDASNVVNRIAELLGGQGNLRIDFSTDRELFRFGGEYSAGQVQDDGRGNAHVQNLVALPSLAAFLGLTAHGRMGPSDSASSIFNDRHNAISYEVAECADSGGTISAPVIACVGMFCGKTNPVNVCGGELWIGPLRGSGVTGEQVTTTGEVGVSPSAVGNTDSIVPSVSGQPLVPQESVFVIEPGETKTYTAQAQCGAPGVYEGTVNAFSGGSGHEAENINVLSCRCQPGEPDCDRTWGSPHLVTGDGLAYDYYASGDHVLQRVPGIEGLEVQGRFLPGMGVSWPQAVAMQVGEDVVEIHGNLQRFSLFPVSHRLEIYINGHSPFSNNEWQPVEQSRHIRLPGGGTIYFDQMIRRRAGLWVDPIAVTVIWPKSGPFEGYAVRVSGIAFSQSEGYDYAHLPPIIDITLHRPDTYTGQERGMLGTNDGDPANDLTRRNGQVIDFTANLSWTVLYGLFGGDWLVRPGECLFRNGCIEPGFPSSPVILDPEQRLIAEIACSNLEGWYREACIHDVGLIGSVDVVQGLYANTADLNQMAGQIVQPGVDIPLYQLQAGEVDASGFVERRAFQVQHLSGTGEYMLLIRPPRGFTAVLAANNAASLVGSGNLDDEIVLSCMPDPNWSELGALWPAEGYLQLWAMDPLSGGLRHRLDEIPLPQARVNPDCIRVSAEVMNEPDEPARILIHNAMTESAQVRLLPAPGLVFDPDVLAEFELCADCSIELDTGAPCPSARALFAQMEVRDSAGVLHTRRPLFCKGTYSSVSRRLHAGMWSGFGVSEVLLADSDQTLWNLSYRNNVGSVDATRRAGGYPRPTHQAVLAGRTIRAVAAAERHSVALLDDGEVWTWGFNGQGQLGIGHTQDQPSPTHVNAIDAPVKSIAVGRMHTLALDVEGRLWAWGGNSYGQLGDNGSSHRLSPYQVDLSALGGEPIEVIATGRYYSMILDGAGRLWAWGRNNQGQLALGHTQTRRVPTLVDLAPLGGAKIAFLSTGESHVLAVDELGEIWAWGSNTRGQLGTGNQTTSLRPVAVNTSAWFGARAVWALADNGGTDGFSLALDSDGRLWSWGSNGEGQLAQGDTDHRPLPTQIDLSPLNGAAVRVAALGGANGFLIDSSERVWAWGHNSHAQLGDNTSGSRLSLTTIGAFGQDGLEADVDLLGTATRVAVGSNRDYVIAVARVNNRRFITDATHLALADPRQDFSGEPSALMFAETFTRTWRGISMHESDLCPSLGPQEVDVGLLNPEGMVLDAAQAPVHCAPDLQVQSRRTLLSLDLHLRNASPLTLDVRIRTAGGYTMNGNDAIELSLCPNCEQELEFDQLCPALGRHHLAVVETLDAGAQVLDVQSVDCGVSDRFVAASSNSSFAVDAAGQSWGWGSTFGAASPTTNQLRPLQVDRSMLSGGRPYMFSNSINHIQVLDGEGRLWGWGDNHYGQLGNGNHYSQFIHGPPGFVSFQRAPLATTGALTAQPVREHAAGSGFSLGIDAEGRVWSWGDNGHSNLGDMTYVDQPKPIPVAISDRGIRLAAEGSFALILVEGGLSYWALGDNGHGQFGNGTTRPQQGPEFHMHRPPVRVDWISADQVPLVDLATGYAFTLALDANGRVWSWGQNYAGALGDGSTVDRTVPGPVNLAALEGARVVAIAATGRSSFALDEHGRLWVWGNNYSGELGLGIEDEEVLLPRQLDPASFDGAQLVDIAIGSDHVIVLDALGRHWAWGTNWAGQLGIGSTNDQRQPVLIYDFDH